MSCSRLMNKNWIRLLFQKRQMTSGPSYLAGAGPESDVTIESICDKSVITLNRPKALNALNISMIRKIIPVLKKCQTSNDMKMIIIKGAGGKAFCAGGDIKAVAEGVQEEFFTGEYQLNYAIGTSKVPWVAIIDGITMGGGLGLSVHGHFRIATERTMIAMPETAIGLIPDVGGGYFLPRLAGRLGVFLGLTGYRLKGKDVFSAGIATHFIESNKIADLEAALLSLKSPNLESIEDLLNYYHNKTTLDKNKPFSLATHMSLIDQLFASDVVEDVVKELEKDGSDWSKSQLTTLMKMSPTSLKVTMEQLRRGKSISLKEDLEMEYRIVLKMMKGQDFYEGVRAVIIDKDFNPKWVPKRLEDVTIEAVNSHFERRQPGELVL